MNYQITIEGRRSMAQIQKDFKDHLNQKQILIATSKALNNTTKKVAGLIRKEVRAGYTVNSKYLERMGHINKFAQAINSKLYTESSFNYRTIPMIGFKHSGQGTKKGKSFPVKIEIKRGQPIALNHAFIRTMKSGHEGIFAAGRYTSGKFVKDDSRTPSGRLKIAELSSASPFTMATSRLTQSKIQAYVDKNLPASVRYLLQREIDKALGK